MKVSVLFFAVLACTAQASDPIIVPSKDGGATHLLLFVPGGKVPPKDYIQLVNSTIQTADTKLVGAIATCGQLNLCNPLGQLNSEMDKAVSAAEKAEGKKFAPENIFVFGHSLGGPGARHYVDTKGTSSFAGLAILGTSYNGDHEDFKGTLGYPTDLSAFPIPFLALLGELDMLPISHSAQLFDLNLKLDDKARVHKPVVIIAGMDHSQFCSPFHVAGDLKPEISDADATASASAIQAAWIDAIVSDSANANMQLQGWMEKWTEPITRAFRQAQALEKEDWCRQAQLTALTKLPAKAQSQVGAINVLVRNASAALEHGHTNFTLNAVTGKVDLQIVSYAYYPQVSSWNPVKLFAPTYAAASDISCKLVSSDRVAEQVGAEGFFPQKAPDVTCADINAVAFQKAISLLDSSWPASVKRFESQPGKSITYEKDKSTIAGPQWVFLSSLEFDESGKDSAKVTSPYLFSSITSRIYPGNFYCKVLSPAKAVEWIQTKSLIERY